MLAAAFLFNLGQGVLRPSLPLYLRETFGASYRMVTLIPVVFGAGKWIASMPTGALLDRGRRVPLMVTGLLIVAAADLLSLVVVRYPTFLGVRAGAGTGWAMVATVATTAMVHRNGARGRAVSALLMMETFGLLLGTAAGGWLYERAGRGSPFLVEAACLVIAAAVVGSCGIPAPERRPPSPANGVDRGLLRSVVRAPGVLLVCVVSAALMAIQTGVLVFLFPLYLLEQGGMSPQAAGSLVALSVAGRLGALWIGGGASDRRDRMALLSRGLVGFGVVLGTLPLASTPWLLGVWSVLLGAGGGFVAGLPATIVGDRIDASQHGRAIGALRTAADTGMLLGPLVMGPLADALGLAAPFLAAALMLCVLAWACGRHAGPPS